MIELPDLFHETRIHELTLSFILYTPIGLVLVLIRSLALLLLFLISSVLSTSSSLDHFLNTAISWVLTITYVNEIPRNEAEDGRRRTKILVANRVSLLDVVVLRQMISTNPCKVVNLSREHFSDNWFKSSMITSPRTEEDLLDLCVKEIQNNDTPLLFLPECEPTTGSDGLLKFNLLPFTLAYQLQLPILPVCLRTSRPFHIRTSTFNSHPSADLFWFLFSPYTHYHINLLSTIFPTDSSSTEVLCERVRENIARKIEIELTEFDEQEVAELKKRPDLFRRRQAQRRAEFQQTINRIHQEVPLASVEAIRHDLETTRNVEKTVANMKERAAALARVANQSSSAASSRAINKSSSGSSHRQTYERLKQELIERNRQLFLSKNSN